MSSSMLYRLSGGTLLVGGLLLLGSTLLSAFLYPGEPTPQQVLSSFWPLMAFLFLAGTLLISLGLPGLYLRQTEHAGRLGFASFALLWLGMLLGGVGFGLVQVTLFPSLAQSAPKLLGAGAPVAAFLFLVAIPALLLAVGSILLGIASMRARIFPRWAGMLLLVTGIMMLVNIPLSSLAGDLIRLIWNVTFSLAFGWFGYALVAQGKESAAATERSTPTAQTSH